MVKAQEIIRHIEKEFPSTLRASWDNTDGLICGDLDNEVKTVCLSLELRENLVNADADMIIVHHPPLFGKDRDVTNKFYTQLKNKPIIYAVHSRIDVAGFMNTALGRKIFGVANLSQPKILADGTAIFKLKTPLKLVEAISKAKQQLKLPTVNVLAKHEMISTIAVHGGEGFNRHHVKDAIAEGVDLYLAGDLTHHLAEFADWYAVSFIDILHFTEQEGMSALKDLLAKQYPQVKFSYVPQAAWWQTQ